MKNFLQRSIGDLLSLIIGSHKEDYEPTRDHYIFFFVSLACIFLFIILYLFI